MESPARTRVPQCPDDLTELSVVVLCYRAEDLARQFMDQLTRELEEAEID